MTEIKFKNLTAKIDSLGAQLRSLTKDGKEFLWQGDERFWTDTAPILFPICGSLKNDKYTLFGKEYFLEKHGFASKLLFSAHKTSESCVKFIAHENNNTLKNYPYKFTLTVTFTLTDNALTIEYGVKNDNDIDMYYSIGSHEGYKCDGGIENYDIIFSDTESFESFQLDGPVLSHKKQKILPNGNKIRLKNEYFEIDALIFENINSDKVSLLNQKSGKFITVDVKDFENLLIWTKPDAEFVCLEPWNGFPDFTDSDGDFTKKHSIQKIAPRDVSKKTHTIHI